MFLREREQDATVVSLGRDLTAEVDSAAAPTVAYEPYREICVSFPPAPVECIHVRYADSAGAQLLTCSKGRPRPSVRAFEVGGSTQRRFSRKSPTDYRAVDTQSAR